MTHDEIPGNILTGSLISFQYVEQAKCSHRHDSYGQNTYKILADHSYYNKPLSTQNAKKAKKAAKQLSREFRVPLLN